MIDEWMRKLERATRDDYQKISRYLIGHPHGSIIHKDSRVIPFCNGARALSTLNGPEDHWLLPGLLLSGLLNRKYLLDDDELRALRDLCDLRGEGE